MTQAITLNPEQAIAIDSLLDFLQDPDPVSQYFVLSGFAGTGKTFCLREVVSRMADSKMHFEFTAPTNKAVKVLRAITGKARTIYSLLGLTVDKSGELKKIISAKHPNVGIETVDAIFIDEGSMVNKVLLAELNKLLTMHHFKVVFMGDPAQLPPVGETSSPIWALGNGANLEKVMRHDNQILALATEVRKQVTSLAPCITIKSHHDENGGVWKHTKSDFKQKIYQAVIDGKFADGAESKVIAWRNVRVKEYNDLIRDALWGAQSQSVAFFEGERVVAAGPCERGDEVLMSTDEEAVVQKVVNCRHPLVPKYAAIELTAATEGGRTVRLIVLAPESKAVYDADCELMANEARTNSRLWKRFWDHKEMFHDIRYAYAITAHRSQGSTYRNVYVDYQDILLNRNRREAFQCLYVACTRPTTELHLA